ncbi:MAG: pyridoxamine 5'-phosphate oxidase family protein [Armatimonadota bacterium]
MKPEAGSDVTSETSRAEARRSLRRLLREQRLCVLSTHRDGAPYASLVAFVASEDLGGIIFTTPRGTRKFENIKADPRVAVLIDNARELPADCEKAAAVTATGRAVELSDGARAEAAERFCEAHRHMRQFVADPSTALICIQVETYYVVRHFQDVTELPRPTW